MRFINFPESNNTAGENDGKINFYAENEEGGELSVLCLQLSDKEIKALRKNDGKIWIVSRSLVPPAIMIQLDNPFKPQYNAQNSSQGSGDNKQPNEGDHSAPTQ